MAWSLQLSSLRYALLPSLVRDRKHLANGRNPAQGLSGGCLRRDAPNRGGCSWLGTSMLSTFTYKRASTISTDVTERKCHRPSSNMVYLLTGSDRPLLAEPGHQQITGRGVTVGRS